MTGTNPPSRNSSPDASARQAPPPSKASARPPAHHHYSDEELHNVDVAHELGEIDVRTIVLSGVSIFVVAGAAALAMLVLLNVLNSRADANEATLSPLAMPADQQPPTPRLLRNEPANLRKFREKEDETLHSYGWVEKEKGIAQIPIDEAKKKLLERGLPARTTPVDDRTGTHAPAMGMPSSGRTIPVK